MDDDYWDDVGDINVDILEVREIKLNDIITSMGSNLTKSQLREQFVLVEVTSGIVEQIN